MNNVMAPHTLAVSGSNTATLLATARLTGVGDLLKTGTGTLILNAANTYSGATSVDQGTLKLGATGSIASSTTINVANGATFDVADVAAGFQLASGRMLRGTGTIVGPVTVNGTLNPGVSAAAAGTLTFNDDLTLAGASVFDLVGAACDRIALSTTATLYYGGSLAVEVSGTPVAGEYQLFSFTNAPSGFFSTVTVPAISGFEWYDYGGGSLDYFNEATGKVKLVGLAAVPRTWTGAAAASPNLMSLDGNWQEGTAPQIAHVLVFGDLAAAANRNPNTGDAPGEVAVAGITFNALTVDSTDTYTLGGTKTLSVAGPITANASATIGAPVTLAAAGGPVAAASGAVLTISAAVGGTQGLTKTGVGKVALTAADNSYTGDTAVNDGILQVDAGINANDTGGDDHRRRTGHDHRRR